MLLEEPAVCKNTGADLAQLVKPIPSVMEICQEFQDRVRRNNQTWFSVKHSRCAPLSLKARTRRGWAEDIGFLIHSAHFLPEETRINRTRQGTDQGQQKHFEHGEKGSKLLHVLHIHILHTPPLFQVLSFIRSSILDSLPCERRKKVLLTDELRGHLTITGCLTWHHCLSCSHVLMISDRVNIYI